MTTERKTWRGAPGEAQTSGPRFAARSLLLSRVFKSERPDSALDIQCGRGGITRILARYASSIIATEATPQAVEAASAGLRDCHNVSVRMVNPFDGGSNDISGDGPFDLILLSEVLEHLDDDVGALMTIRSLLAEDGLLVITVPRDPRLWSLEDELWDHKRRYERSELERMLSDTGFELDILWTWGFPITKWIVKFQVNRMRPRGSDVRDGPPPVTAPPSLLMPVVRLGSGLIARSEQLFKHADRGLGYVATARKAGPAPATGAPTRGVLDQSPTHPQDE